MTQKIGYVRVSTDEQNVDLQVDALEINGCDEIYIDRGVSGSKRERTEFNIALNLLQEGDTLVIWRLDRMSRSLKHLIEINEFLNSKGAYFESIMEKIDTSAPMGEFVFHILGAVAQLERTIIIERTNAGLASAAKKGNFPGRPRILNDSDIVHIYEQICGGRKVPELAKELKVSNETIRRRVLELEIAV